METYILTSFVLLRLLGFVYVFAFLSLVKQLIPLLGENGLTPARSYLDSLQPYFKSKWSALWNIPTVFWIYISDRFMMILAWIGLLLSVLVLIGYANFFILFFLWLIYMSFIHIGQVWYGYGWGRPLL